MNKFFTSLFLFSLLSSASVSTMADDAHQLAGNVKGIDPSSHAPIGVMGDHMHKQGEWMISYRAMTMEMKNLLQGSDSISTDEVASSVSNPYAPPATVRVVPVKMRSQMQMVGMMYAPSNDITLVGMLSYVEKKMDAKTYQGMMGTNVLGKSSVETSGMGDSKIAALWRVYEQNGQHVHLNFGLSLPTGDIEKTATVLTPMNMKMKMAYGMQLGSGTYDLEPGITYTGHHNDLGWGAQYKAIIRTGKNSQDYRLGDGQEVTAWGSYRFAPSASGSLRLTYADSDDINGSDSNIKSPALAANPDNYGREQLNVGLGINLIGQQGVIRGHRLGVEYVIPVYQNVNGVQLEAQNMLALGYQYSW